MVGSTTDTISFPMRMSEQEAWEIAMVWRPQLQGNTRLVIDQVGPIHSILESYAWVRIDLAGTGASPEAISIIRAVMLTWTMLAECPGFSGSDNPGFWRSVLRELQTRQDQASRSRDHPDEISDAVGFFNQPEHMFPRFRLRIPPSLGEAISTMLTVTNPSAVDETSKKLRELISRLRMFQSRHLPHPGSQVIDMCIEVSSRVMTENAAMGMLSGLVRSINSNQNDSNDPEFVLCKIQFPDTLMLSSDAEIDNLVRFTEQFPGRIGHFQLMPLLTRVTREHRAKWLRACLQLDPSVKNANASSFSFARHNMCPAVFAALMSALPFARSLHSLTVDTNRMEHSSVFEETDLAWIAYALYHPHASSSSFRYLDLDKLNLTPRSTFVLTAMSRGNNLLALLNSTPPESNAYVQAKLIMGASVHLEPNAISEVVFVAPAVGHTMVDVCSITSLDPAAWADWIAVIVPAYGLGWVRARDLREVRALPPSKSKLDGLRLGRKWSSGETCVTEDLPEAVLHVLEPLGASLKHLDVRSYTNMSAATLTKILQACPSLKTLRVSHNGDLWHQSSRVTTTQLEELELNLHFDNKCLATPTLDHLTQSLSLLRALRIRVPDSDLDRLQSSRAALEQLLRHATNLRYLHWELHTTTTSSPWQNCFRQLFTAAERRTRTQIELQRLGLSDASLLVSTGSLTPSCAAAFLSIIKRESEVSVSALGHLTDRGVQTAIFQFATSRVPKAIHIESSRPAAWS